MHTWTTWLVRIPALIGAVLTVFALGAVPAEAASVSGGSASGYGYYSNGVYSSGSVTASGSTCVHADVKLALGNGINDYKWTEARACNRGTSSWSRRHIGPILSSFSRSTVQGVYLRVCRERSGLPDDCGSWQYIGR